MFAMFVMSGLTFADDDASLFDVDKQAIEQEVAPLNDLENYVNANDGVTYNQIDNPSVLNKDVVLGDVDLSSQPPLGIPSFLWGFILGVVGILIVYLVSENGDETKKALWGCLAFAVFWTVLWLVIFAGATATVTSGI
jgi:hypothetical protein